MTRTPLLTATNRLLLCYKNFAGPGISHVGLGNAALNTAKTFRAHGVDAIVLAAKTVADITAMLDKDASISHVVVSAPWIVYTDMATLVHARPHINFAVNCHSNVGFLQADPNGVDLIKQYIQLEQGSLNFEVSANSRKGTQWVRGAYQCPCLYLPNLFYVDYSVKHTRPLWNGGLLRIGAFGATRPLKNLMSAAGAALLIKNTLKAQTEFWISAGRLDGGMAVVKSIQAMLAGVPGITLVQNSWQSWPMFRDTIREMNLLISVSYSESFNMVTGDGIAEGVPSVVSGAIDWVPSYWKAEADDTEAIARVGLGLLRNPDAGMDGLVALEQHNKSGFTSWVQWLGIELTYKSLLASANLI